MKKMDKFKVLFLVAIIGIMPCLFSANHAIAEAYPEKLELSIEEINRCSATDFNKDGIIDIQDLMALTEGWLQDGADSGKVNFLDYTTLSDCWLFSSLQTVNLELSAGFNKISFNALPEGNSFDSVFAGFDASNGDAVIAPNGANATYFDGSWYGKLTEIKPGVVYVLKAANAQVFSYVDSAALSDGLSTEEMLDAPPAGWTNPVGLENIMVIYGSVTYLGAPIGGVGDGSLLAAFEGGSVAGVTEAINGPGGTVLFALTVFSDSTTFDDMTLRLYNGADDTVYNINETFNFVANDTLGLLWAPVPFTADLPPAGVPDLSINTTAVDPVAVEAGDNVDVTVTIENIGDTDAVATTVDIFLSDDDTVDWTTLAPVESFNLAALDAGDSTSITQTITMPAVVGMYYVRAKVNSVAGEVAVANNWGSIRQVDVVAPPVWNVTFDLDGKGTRIGGGDLVQTVTDGDDAVAPEVQGDPGWRFIGWDIGFTNVTADLTVTAQYAPSWSHANPAQPSWDIPLAPNIAGAWDIESGITAANSYSGLIKTINPTAAFSNIRFTVKTSCSVKAALIFYIDGVYIEPYWVGNTPETVVEVPFDNTTITEFMWVFSKSGAAAMGEDKVWVTDIELIP